jgi:hypothetical protein
MANQVSGGSNVSHINGPMIKITRSTDVFTFPVGNGGFLGQIGIAPQDNNNNSFQAQYFRSQGFAGAEVEKPLDFVSSLEYWRLDRLAGNSSGKISLHWTANGNISLKNNDWSDVRVARYSNKADNTKEGTNSVDGIWQSRGNSAVSPTASASSGYITSDIISNFSPYTFGSYSQIPLPVELLYLRAIPNNGTINVEWSTASEHKSKHFILQRSRDGINFTSIATIKAAGESKTVRTYAHTDKQPFAGNNYYRLLQVDNDGSVVTSKIVSVNINGASQSKFEVYPNPSDGKTLHLQLNYEGEITVSVFTMTGVEIINQRSMATGSITTIQPRNGLAPGMYVVRVVTLQGTYQQKLLVK